MEVLDHVDRAEIERLRATTDFFWLDLMAPSAQDIDTVAEMFGLHPIAVEDLKEFDQRPKIDDYEHFLHIVYFGMEDDEAVEVHLIVHGDAMVTVRRDHCASLLGAHARVEATPPDREEYAVYRVLDSLTDSFFPLIERIDDEIDALEDVVVEGNDTDCLHKIVSLKGRLSELRRRVTPQRDILATAGNLFQQLPGFNEEDAHDYFRDVYDHLLRIADSIETFRDELTSMLDVYLSAQSNRLNQWITRLTVIGTIFLPLTFLTGFFGQNFGWLVHHINSFGDFLIFGVAIEVVSIALLVVWFRRAGVRE
jgi:magnesium transporter